MATNSSPPTIEPRNFSLHNSIPSPLPPEKLVEKPTELRIKSTARTVGGRYSANQLGLKRELYAHLHLLRYVIISFTLTITAIIKPEIIKEIRASESAIQLNIGNKKKTKNGNFNQQRAPNGYFKQLHPIACNSTQSA